MPQEFEGDLDGAVFWGASLRGAEFRDVDLTGATISHAMLVGVDIDAVVDRLVVNGVDVTAYVNERDPWFPLRSRLRPADPDAARAAWAALETEWATTVGLARALPDDALHRSVDGEFSFVQTVRHLVFAVDKWWTGPVLGAGFDPMGLPNTGSLAFPWPGVDPASAPSLDEALAVWDDRRRRVGEALASLAATDLDRVVDVLENGPNPVRECVFTVVEETFWHIRYARRDLARLEPTDHR